MAQQRNLVGADVETPDNERQRLPTLLEVLSRRTMAPVDLFSFYIYMRDQQRSVDYLDFWLDVSQHMSLCRHYVRELRRSVLLETPDLQKAGSKRSSQILDSFNVLRNGDPNNGNSAGPAASVRSNRTQDQRLSAFLRSDAASNHSSPSSVHKESSDSSGDTSPEALPQNRPATSGTQRSFGLNNNSPHERTSNSRNGGTTPNRPSFMGSALNSSHGRYSSSPGNDNESTPHHTLNRGDIRASAEKILYTYLLPGSEREIILPHAIVAAITEDIEAAGRDDPEVFDASKDYVYQAMERDAFPGFLRAKALGNLVPPSLMLRLIVGLLALFAGFWAAFILVFTDASRARRCWLILPFLVGVYSLASHQYTLDPVMAFAGLSELTFFNWAKVKEPYVRRLLGKRAIMVSWWILWIVAALSVLFVFVPGKYL